MVELFDREELKQLIDEIVDEDEADESLTPAKVMRQVGGRLQSPLGSKKKEIQQLVEEAVGRKLSSVGRRPKRQAKAEPPSSQVEASHEELRDLVNEIVEEDEPDDSFTSGKVLRQVGGKLRTPLGDRKREIQELAEEAVGKKLQGYGNNNKGGKTGKELGKSGKTSGQEKKTTGIAKREGGSSSAAKGDEEPVSTSEIRELIEDVVDEDIVEKGETRKTLTSGKVLRQVGGKLRAPLGDRKKEYQKIAEEVVDKTFRGVEEADKGFIVPGEEEPNEEVEYNPEEDVEEGDEDEDLEEEEELAEEGEEEELDEGDEEILRQAAEMVGVRRSAASGGPKTRQMSQKRKSGDDEGDEGSSKHRQLAILRQVKLSPELAKVLGKETASRQELGKKMRHIFSQRNLYDPKNKRYVNCDDQLSKIFGEKRVDASNIMQYLDQHIRDD